MKNRLDSAVFLPLLCAALAGCAASGAKTPEIPAALSVPANQVLTQQLRATGVQIYQCQSMKNDPAKFEWTFKQPEANLFTRAGRSVGKHYAGPTWEADDGSKVIGELIARANSPEPGAIPWLLLSAKSTSGNGMFTAVKSIQRLRTVGGSAPYSCDQADAGRMLRVSYSADYLFYTAKP